MEKQVNQSVVFAIGTKIDLQASMDKSGLTNENDKFDKNDTLIHTDRRKSTLVKMGKNAKWIYCDVPIIQVVNTLRSQPQYEVTERHKRQFAQQWNDFMLTPEYRAFVSRDEDEESSYRPISEMLGKVKGAGAGTIKTLKVAGIRTVEMLAKADPNDISHVRKWEELQLAAMEMVETVEAA